MDQMLNGDLGAHSAKVLCEQMLNGDTKCSTGTQALYCAFCLRVRSVPPVSLHPHDPRGPF